MKSMTMRTNPAFKQTQPLPVLPVDFAQRAGWAAKSFAQAAGAWPVAAVRAAGAVVKPGLDVRMASAMG